MAFARPRAVGRGLDLARFNACLIRLRTRVDRFLRAF
jgi:hypothetical protein